MATLAGCTEIEHGPLASDVDLKLMAQKGIWLNPQAGLGIENFVRNQEKFVWDCQKRRKTVLKDRILVGIVPLLLAVCIASIVGKQGDSVSGGSASSFVADVPADEEDKPAEQVFKNIQVFKGLPSRQLRPAMAFMAASLGVNCEFCHINPWESDAKPTKAAARRMVLMMRTINRENFGGNASVSCATCHNGGTKPTTVSPAASLASPQPRILTNDATSVSSIFDRYVNALGGQSVLSRLQTRETTAEETTDDGSKFTVKTYAKAPNLFASITTSDKAKTEYLQTFDGETGWSRFNNGRVNGVKGLDLAALTRAAEFYNGLSYFRTEFAHITLQGKTELGSEQVYVIRGRNDDSFYEDLFFSATSGLLVRRRFVLSTALGPVALGIDYDDYRAVDGTKTPFVTRWFVPGNGSWTDRLTDIHHNVTMDDKRFIKPGVGP
jgi:photosynthetic reaction center cytochrome c subunit